MDITGASAIVTGGASGIGAACAELLAERGAKVVIADLQDDKGKELAAQIGGAFCHVDVTKTDEIIAAVETAKEMGPLRVLVVPFVACSDDGDLPPHGASSSASR